MVGAPADRALLRRQRAAQRRHTGTWANGVPATILTSVHSATESPSGGAYLRVVDTRTGLARTRPRAEACQSCQPVCFGVGPDRSCMLYVPFERRYRGRPDCLRRRR